MVTLFCVSPKISWGAYGSIKRTNSMDDRMLSSAGSGAVSVVGVEA